MRQARRGSAACLLAGISSLTGCYTTRQLTTAPEPGTTVLLDLNDRARLQLGERIGPGATRIEGIVRAPSDTAYLINISAVQYLNGQSNKWSGEPFAVPVNLVSNAQRRDFSRSRTTAVGAAFAAVITTLFLKTNFFGSAGNTRDPIPPVPPVS